MPKRSLSGTAGGGKAAGGRGKRGQGTRGGRGGRGMRGRLQANSSSSTASGKDSIESEYQSKRGLESSGDDVLSTSARTRTLESRLQNPISDDGEEEYEVELIVNHQKFDGVDFYLVKWVGYPPNENSWVARGNMACDEKIDEFHRRHTPNEVDMAPMYRIINPAANTPPLSVVNTVDNVNTVEDFTYINSCKYSKSVPVPADMLFPCECDGGCRNDCPCVEKQYYDDNGRVRVGHEEPIFECSEQCTCGPECPSRVVQRGSAIQFEIFRLPQKGWGVRAKHKVERGTFIIEYVGEIIDYDEVERRGIEDRKAGNTYLFDLDSDYSANEIADFSIDARRYGNISRFFNHSCDPNMAIWSVYIEHHDPRLPRLVFFAIRDIEEDEELTLDYNPGESCEGRLESPCYCGSSNCRKQIFF